MSGRHGLRWTRTSGLVGLMALAWVVVSCDDALVDKAPGSGRPDRLVAVSGPRLVTQLRGAEALLQMRVVDRSGRGVRAAVVRYQLLAGRGVFAADSTLTDDQGFTQVQFLPTGAGTAIVEARTVTPDGVRSVQFEILVRSDPREAATLDRVGGEGQSGAAGSFLAEPLEVRVLNPDGFPVADHPVTFALGEAPGGGAEVALAREGMASGQLEARTDAAGVARAFFKLGNRTGTYTVAARTLGGPPEEPATLEVTFTATATSPPATRLVVIAGNNQTAVIDTLNSPDSPGFRGREPNPFVVQALDAFDQPVAGVAVQWRVSDGGGSLLAATTLTDTAGLAENRLLAPTEGRNAVVALAPGTNAVEFVVTGVVHQPAAE